MASPDALDLAALEDEIPADGLTRTLFEELKRLRNVSSSTPENLMTKRAVALLKDHDLFTDLRTTKSSLSVARKYLKRTFWKTTPHPLITKLVFRLQAFEKSVETAESRLIEEHQDA